MSEQSTRSGTPRDTWVVGRLAAGTPRVRLLCFPHAGGAAGAFSAWRSFVPDGVEMAPVELPGRGTRFADPLPGDLDTLVDDLLEALKGEFDLPYALFGHSFGALVAYELALRTARFGIAPPLALLVSAARAPQTATPPGGVHERDDAGMLEWLRTTGGMPESLLRHTEYVRLVVRSVRADLTLAARHHRRRADPPACPLHVFGGRDDPVVRPAELEDWEACAGSDSDVTITLYPGDHFYPYTDPGPLLRYIGSVLETGRLPERKTER